MSREIDLSLKTKAPKTEIRDDTRLVWIAKTATSAWKWAGKVPDRCCIFHDTVADCGAQFKVRMSGFWKKLNLIGDFYHTWQPWCNDNDLNIICKSNTNLRGPFKAGHWHTTLICLNSRILNECYRSTNDTDWRGMFQDASWSTNTQLWMAHWTWNAMFLLISQMSCV